MTTFIKPTEIPIDGAHTLPREYFTSPDIHAAELERIFYRRWLCVGRDRPYSPAGRLLHPAGGDGERHRPARSLGRVPGLLQRLPAPRHPAVRGAHRPLQRDDPVSLPRLDLRPRRPADRRALHRRPGELQQGRLAAPPRGRGHLGRVPLHQPGPRSRAVRHRLGEPAGPVEPVQPPQPAGAPDHRVRCGLQLEAAVPELQRVLPLRAGPPVARQAHPADQRGERPDRGAVHRRVHGAEPRASTA